MINVKFKVEGDVLKISSKIDVSQLKGPWEKRPQKEIRNGK